MSVQTACGTATISSATTVGNTAFSVSGLAFQPKAIIFNWSGRTAAGTGEADANFGVGIAVSTSSRRAYAKQSDHGNATNSQTDRVWRNDACITTMSVTGTVGGHADLSAIASDGFTVVVDDQFPANLIVGWIAIGGSDVTNVGIVDFNLNLTTGDQDITGLGFALDTGLDDKAVLILGAATDVAVNTIAGAGAMALGVAAGNSISQAVLAGFSQDAAGTQNTSAYCRSGEVICGLVAGGAGVSIRASLTAWLSDGFRINIAETPGTGTSDASHSALVLKGGRYSVGSLTTATDTTPFHESTPYNVKGAIFFSSGRAEDASDTPTDHEQMSFGVATSPSQRWASCVMDKDAATTSDVGISFATDACYVNLSTAATIVVEGQMDSLGFGPTGMRFVMDDADPSGAFVAYLAIGEVMSEEFFPHFRNQPNIPLRM